MSRACSRALLAAAIALAGCSDAPRDAPGIERVVLELDHDGLSGLTTDGDGTHWAVAERDRVMVAIDGERVTRIVPLRGVPDGLDLEAIAWVEGRRFAIGSEAADPDRDADRIFEVEIVDAEARVTRTRRMPYGAVGARPADNDGIEGLCAIDGALIAALEHPSGRVATLAVHDGAAWSGRRVHLTTSIGKLGGLACRTEGDAVRVWAIERGLDRGWLGDTWVARIVSFELPEGGATAQPRVVASFEGRLADRPNPEGLTLVGDDALVIVDNHYRVRTGDTTLLRTALAPPR